jgi:predicted nucleic acid-binding protein
MNPHPLDQAVLFLHANVLISAAWREGTEIAKIWQLQEVALLTSDYVIQEVLRNLRNPEQIERLRRLMRTVRLIPIANMKDYPEAAALPEKDRAVLLGAIHLKATHLISGDKKHFGPLYGQIVHGVRITPPSEILSYFRLKTS